jgi:hypothetical protein
MPQEYKKPPALLSDLDLPLEDIVTAFVEYRRTGKFTKPLPLTRQKYISLSLGVVFVNPLWWGGVLVNGVYVVGGGFRELRGVGGSSRERLPEGV